MVRQKVISCIVTQKVAKGCTHLVYHISTKYIVVYRILSNAETSSKTTVLAYGILKPFLCGWKVCNCYADGCVILSKANGKDQPTSGA